MTGEIGGTGNDTIDREVEQTNRGRKRRAGLAASFRSMREREKWEGEERALRLCVAM
jgi:hypothetical protein